jgi:raffinose/stachyose/melibiose transport system substrate-binding protein
MKTKLSMLFVALVIASVMLAACGGAAATEAPGGSAATSAPAGEGGELYYLNFKPEVADLYAKIGEAWKAETGNTLKVVTAASGTYEQTLKSEIAKSDPPVLFQINGPVGYAALKDYTADLSGIELYKHLSDKNLAVTDGDGVYGLPYVIEGYGIIYNNAIMDKYFATEGAKAASMDEVNSFDTLKAVADDMQAKKADLGIEGVFCATSLKPGEDWRWQTHLANMPVFYEFRDNNVDVKDPEATKEIKFEDAENFKNIFDLYINDSTVPDLR